MFQFVEGGRWSDGEIIEQFVVVKRIRTAPPSIEFHGSDLEFDGAQLCKLNGIKNHVQFQICVRILVPIRVHVLSFSSC